MKGRKIGNLDSDGMSKRDFQERKFVYSLVYWR